MKPLAPVFFKELYQMAQSRRLAILKWLFLGCLFIGFMLCAAEGSRGYNQGEFGVMLFVAVSVLCAGAVLLFAPIMTASVISGEREANTLGLLFLTRLSAWNIVQDKGLSRMMLLFYITGLSFPLLSAGLLYGGIEAVQVWIAIANLFALGLFTSGVAILSSALRSKFSSAIVTTYLVLIVWYLIVPLTILFVQSVFRFAQPDIYLLARISPFVSVGLSFDGPGMGLWGAVADRSWMWNLGIGLGVYLFCSTIAAILVRRMALKDTAHVTAESRGFGVALKRFGYVMAHANPFLIFHKQRLMNQNPVTWQYSRLAPGSSRAGLYNLANVFGLAIVGILLFGLMLEALGSGFAWRPVRGRYMVDGAVFYALAIGVTICFGFLMSRLTHSLSVKRVRPSTSVWVFAALSVVGAGAQIWYASRVLSARSYSGATGQFLPEAVTAYTLAVCLLLVMGGLSIWWYCVDDDGFRRERMDRMWMLTNFLNAGALLGATIWGYVLASGDYIDDDPFYFFFFMVYGAIVLFAVVLGATTFTREKQSGTFAILLSTRMSGYSIVNGVLLGCWRTMFPMVGLALSIALVAELLDPSEFSFVRASIATFIHVVFALMLAVFLALRRPTLIQALVISLGILAFLYVGIPIFGELADGDGYLVSPGWLIAAGLSQHEFSGNYNDAQGWWLFGNFFLYLPAIIGLYLYMILRFDDIVGRQEMGEATPDSSS